MGVSLLDPLLAQRANAAPGRVVQGVAATPGWHVLAAFVNSAPITAVLEVVYTLGVAGRVLRARVVTANLFPVTNALVTSSATGTVTLTSPPFLLPSAGTYFIQAELTGGAADTDFAVTASARVIQKVT